MNPTPFMKQLESIQVTVKMVGFFSPTYEYIHLIREIPLSSLSTLLSPELCFNPVRSQQHYNEMLKPSVCDLVKLQKERIARKSLKGI
jgi:hypothetical protein